METITKLRKKVEYCLENFPATRNSDVTLTISIWRQFHRVNGAINVSQLYDLPREDNVKRLRAEIQNVEGRFLPTSLEVAKKRRIKEETWLEYIQEGLDIKHKLGVE